MAIAFIYMSKVIVLYPAVPRVRRMFDGVKRTTLPNQCMSLQEMLRRFVRREPLPSAKDGVYIEGDYDLEKIVKMDRVEQDEILEAVKETVSRRKKVVVDEDKRVSEELRVKKEAERAAERELLQRDPKEGSSAKQP